MRLKVPYAGTAAELETALASRWVVLNPHRMFPGEAAAAFAIFCKWAFDCARRGPGKKVFLTSGLGRSQPVFPALLCSFPG